MLKIATHDSGTGERGKTFFHDLFSVFSRCQDKTILEQWNYGVRYFDLRIEKNHHLAHGLWSSKVTIEEILELLNNLSLKDEKNPTYVTVTIERNYSEKIINELIIFLQGLKKKYKNIHFVTLNKKRPKWQTMVFYEKVKCASDYVSVPWVTEWKYINFKNWKRYIPIPRILHKNYIRKYNFNTEYFVMVDFY